MNTLSLFLKRFVRLDFRLYWAGSWCLLLMHLSREWWKNPQYGYGLCVPFLCLWILWQRRAELAKNFHPNLQSFSRTNLSSFILVASALCLLPLELFKQVSPELRIISFIGTAFCLSLTFWTLKGLGFSPIPSVVLGVSILFCTALPWPSFIEIVISQSLMRGIAIITADVLNLLGILARAQGNIIELSTGLVSVDQACSGIRSLQSSIMASVALSLFFRLSAKKGIFLLVLGILIALFGNFFRTLFLTITASHNGISFLEKIHDSTGIGILIAVTLILYFTASKLTPLPEQPSTVCFPNLDWSRLPSVKFGLVVASMALLTARFWFVDFSDRQQKYSNPMLSLNGSAPFKLEEVTLSSSTIKFLRPDTAAEFQGVYPNLGRITVFMFSWSKGSNELVSYFHRPDVCMTSVGWKLSDEIREISTVIDGRELKWYLFDFQYENTKALQAWGVWRNGEEEKISMSQGWKSFLRPYQQRWYYILGKKKAAHTEIFSVVLDGSNIREDQLKQVIQQVFRVSRKDQ